MSMEIENSPRVEYKGPAEWREYAGFTQEDLAEVANVHQTAISQLEEGKRPYNSKQGRRYLWGLEQLGIDRDLVDIGKPSRERRERLDARLVFDEDGYAATAPRRSLEDWRTSRNVTQDELAILTGLSYVTINRIEAGEGKTRLQTRKRLARALRVRPDKLILPGDKQPTETEIKLEQRLRGELRDVRRTLHKAYDVLRDDSSITFKAQDTVHDLLPEIQRELKGT